MTACIADAATAVGTAAANTGAGTIATNTDLQIHMAATAAE